MAEGRVVLLVDGTPFALIVPYLFVENFQSMDDYNYRPYYAVFIRTLKFISFLISVFFPVFMLRYVPSIRRFCRRQCCMIWRCRRV